MLNYSSNIYIKRLNIFPYRSKENKFSTILWKNLLKLKLEDEICNENNSFLGMTYGKEKVNIPIVDTCPNKIISCRLELIALFAESDRMQTVISQKIFAY